MTDLSLSSSTLPVPHADSAVASAPASVFGLDGKPLLNGFALTEEEEDYTIKCICEYEDDDGNTVQCETCETWQHIECYYPGTKGPGEKETHNCVDCDPRPVDGKHATERQQLRRAELDLGDRKVKKPPPIATVKGHKKKIKSEHTNGWHTDKPDPSLGRNGSSGSPRDSQNAKRPKANHRASNSTTHIVPLKLPGQSRRSTSASHTVQSPSKANNPFRLDGEPFSEDFMHLYDNDPGETNLVSNRVGLQMLRNLIEWSEDPDAVKRDANGKSHQEIFWRCEQSLESMNLPLLQKQSQTDASVDWHGAHPKWVYLTVESETPRNAIVGELRGQIGHMNDYVQDDRNRWDDIRHPLPFVFFHPNLPIYIDTRQEGTICRYVRRSCKPNLHLKTILEGSEYHFCLVANRPLQPGELLTIPWTPDEHVRTITRRLGEQPKEESQFDGIAEDEEYVRQFYSKVLAEFGGCACDDPITCTSTLWNRRKATDSKAPNGKAKRGRKNGAKSGQNTGRTASSRSGSEALRYQDDDDQDDSHSTSASSRSKPQSRDLTPSNDLDHLGPDVDDRTKRKIAALEKQEHDKSQPATKKKKRNSGGTSLSVRDAPASANRASFSDSGVFLKGGSASMPNTPGVNTKGRYVDAGTARKGSNSPVTQTGSQTALLKQGSDPHSPVVSSPLASTNYVDSSIQCDMDEDERVAVVKPSPRRLYQSMSKRLLKHFHERRSTEVATKTEPDLDSPFHATPVAHDQITASPIATSEEKDGDGDVAMFDSAYVKGHDPPEPVEIEKPIPLVNDGPPLQPADGAADSSAKPSLSPTQPAPSPTDEKVSTNGYRVNNMHVPIPPKQNFAPPMISTSTSSLSSGTPALGITTSTPTTQTPIAQTPTAATPLLTPGNSSLMSSVVAPSPVKKKLSLGDYMSRRSSNIAKAESASTKEAAAAKDSDSPTAAPGQKDAAAVLAPTESVTKPLNTLAEDATAEAGDKPESSESAILDTPDPPAKGETNEIDKGGLVDVEATKAAAAATTTETVGQEDTRMDDALN